MAARGMANAPKRSVRPQLGRALALATACVFPVAALGQTLLNAPTLPAIATTPTPAQAATQTPDAAATPGVLRTGNFDPADAAPAPSVPEDGNLTVDDTPESLLDGIFAGAEPPAEAAEGEDPANVDQRPASERNEFAFPDDPGALSDSDNPLLFQVEEIEPFDPAQNRRPARFASLDPFDPVGIRIGTFVLFPQAEIALVRDSNVFSSPDGQSDIVGEVRPDLRLVSNWSNHALEFQAAGDLSNHRKFGTENDRAYTLETRGRLDVLRSTDMQGSLRLQEAQEDRSAIDAASAGSRSSVRTKEATAAFNHRFNRLSIQLRGGVTDTAFADDGATPAGVVTPGAAPLTPPFLRGSNTNDRDVLERRAAVRASWQFKPTFSVFAELEGNDRAFEVASSADNRRRDSDGRRLRTGVSFGQSSDILRGEVSVGHASQDLHDARLRDANGFIVDANLAWRITGLTSLLFTAASDISSVTQTANSGAALERRVGLEARHAFRTNLVASTGIEASRRDFAGIDVDESEFVFSLGLDYFMSREAVAFTRYEHTVFRSDFAGADYESDEIRIGLRLRR